MTQHLDQALLAVFRYGDWRQATLRMTDDEQREAAADAVQRAGGGGIGVRWWALPAPTGRERIERLAELLGHPVPPPLTSEKKGQVEAWLTECDQMVNHFWEHPEERAATPGPLVLPAFPTLRSEHGG